MNKTAITQHQGIGRRFITVLLAASLMTGPAAGQADSSRSADDLVFATQLATQANKARERGELDSAQRYARTALETIKQFKSASPQDRDTAAVLRADLTVLNDRIRTERKALKTGSGARAAKIIVVLAALGTGAYFGYRYYERYDKLQNRVASASVSTTGR